ncbi:phosphatidate cytidylyltransferase [Dactylosporangium aurantiacum]|uniref:Phosphatidate cytidylyltransferase n=2 Tax=Dactylosporangium aurantiacum TaxID=35754 RepID=A0A9Q9IL75_9ACTN|nr:phosphatidate cytidylyltransferase [Dactylosporangium aurantiacum]
MTAPGNPSTRARHADAAPEASMPKEQQPDEPHPAGAAQPPVQEPQPSATGPQPATETGRSAAQPPAAQPKRKGAGRNLPAAIGVGVALGGAVLASLFVWIPAFLALVVAAVIVGIWEMARAVGVHKARPPLVPLLAGGPCMVVLAWFGGADVLPLGLLATLLVMLVWRFAGGARDYQRDVTAGALIAVYVPFLGAFAALLAHPGKGVSDGAVRVLVTILAVVLSDTGGYATGVFLGKHPMAPSVSPAKSWEGFAGSIVWTGAGSAVALPLLLSGAVWWHGAIFGIAVSIASVLGDLGESLIKRDLGVKDMSNLLPGHGGLMDRLDSVLLALPTAYAVLAFLVPPS